MTRRVMHSPRADPLLTHFLPTASTYQNGAEFSRSMHSLGAKFGISKPVQPGRRPFGSAGTRREDPQSSGADLRDCPLATLGCEWPPLHSGRKADSSQMQAAALLLQIQLQLQVGLRWRAAPARWHRLRYLGRTSCPPMAGWPIGGPASRTGAGGNCDSRAGGRALVFPLRPRFIDTHTSPSCSWNAPRASRVLHDAHVRHICAWHGRALQSDHQHPRSITLGLISPTL